MVTVVSFALPACLDAPPDYSAPARLPPVVLTAQVDPPLTSVHRISRDTPVDFNIPFRSEDFGDQLIASFFLNLDPTDTDQQKIRNSFLDFIEEPPSSLPFKEQAGRAIDDWTWTPGSSVDPGCHSITMILTHEPARFGFFPEDELDAARLTWWFEVTETSGDGAALLSDCPPASADTAQ